MSDVSTLSSILTSSTIAGTLKCAEGGQCFQESYYVPTCSHGFGTHLHSQTHPLTHPETHTVTHSQTREPWNMPGKDENNNISDCILYSTH